MLRTLPSVKSLSASVKPFTSQRWYTVRMSDYERKIYTKLDKALEPSELDVADISGGCGSMFAINVTSDQFKGLTRIKQHKLVNGILAEDIKQWHGLQLSTKAK